MARKKGQKIIKEECKKFKEYYQKYFPELDEAECINLAKQYTRSSNYQCIEFYEKRYPNLSHDEHLKLKQELQKQRLSNKDTNIEYWKKRYPEKSLDELEELRSKAAKEKNKCNLEYWIKKYPNKSIEEVQEMHNKFYQFWLSHQKGWGKGDKNCNSKNNSTLEERKLRSPKCIEFYEKRYPNLSHDEHLKMLNEHHKKISNKLKSEHKYTTTIEYYLNKGYSLEESYIKLKERQTTFSLKKCIEKYGEEIGYIKYSERQHKWLKSLQKNFKEYGDGRAPQSKFAKEIILEICKYFNIKPPKKEYYLYDKEYKRAYAYDFNFNHHIIEFNGDYWHCNPNVYSYDFFNKTKQKTAKEIWEYDKIKQKLAESYKNKYLVIWELEYNDDKEKTIQKCIDFIKE